VGRPRRWGSGSAAPVSDVAVTEKSDRFRACGTGFHRSSLVGSSFVSPHDAFSFSLHFQPLLGACRACGLWLGTSEHPRSVASWGEHPWLGAATSLGERGSWAIRVEQEHVASSLLRHGLSLALNHKGRSVLSCVGLAASRRARSVLLTPAGELS